MQLFLSKAVSPGLEQILEATHRKVAILLVSVESLIRFGVARGCGAGGGGGGGGYGGASSDHRVEIPVILHFFVALALVVELRRENMRR